MMWLALAAQFSLPVRVHGGVGDLSAVFKANDFPAYLVAAKASRVVYTKTTVRPDGTIQGCVAEVSSGDAPLDAYTCAIIVKRVKFQPATWTDGTAVYGVIRTPVRWVASSGPPSGKETRRATDSDIELSVNRLPKRAGSIAAISLQVAANESGRPVACIAFPPSDRTVARQNFPELVPIACQQVMKSLSFSPVVDTSGKAVRSVQNVSVHFKLDH